MKRAIINISLGLALVVGAVAYGVWFFTPWTNLVSRSIVTLYPPKITNPMLNCVDCLETHGLNPKCLNPCVEDLLNGTLYQTKIPLIMEACVEK